MSNNKDRNITLPLSKFLVSHLGISLDSNGRIIEGDHIYSKKPIWHDIADIIFALTHNHPDYGIHIEYPSADNGFIPQPILWSYREWEASEERHILTKEKAHKQRIADFIFEANVNIISKHLEKTIFLGEAPHSRMIAITWLKHKRLGVIHRHGVSKLIEKEEEL